MDRKDTIKALTLVLHMVPTCLPVFSGDLRTKCKSGIGVSEKWTMLYCLSLKSRDWPFISVWICHWKQWVISSTWKGCAGTRQPSEISLLPGDKRHCSLSTRFLQEQGLWELRSHSIPCAAPGAALWFAGCLMNSASWLALACLGV